VPTLKSTESGRRPRVRPHGGKGRCRDCILADCQKDRSQHRSDIALYICVRNHRGPRRMTRLGGAWSTQASGSQLPRTDMAARNRKLMSWETIESRDQRHPKKVGEERGQNTLRPFSQAEEGLEATWGGKWDFGGSHGGEGLPTKRARKGTLCAPSAIPIVRRIKSNISKRGGERRLKRSLSVSDRVVEQGEGDTTGLSRDFVAPLAGRSYEDQRVQKSTIRGVNKEKNSDAVISTPRDQSVHLRDGNGAGVLGERGRCGNRGKPGHVGSPAPRSVGRRERTSLLTTSESGSQHV